MGTNALIIQLISVEGPKYLGQIAKELPSRTQQWKVRVTPASSAAGIEDRLRDLVARDYLRSKIREEAHPGLESSTYDLTFRGDIVALALPYVRRNLKQFMSFERDGDNEVLALGVISAFIDKGIASEYWQHFIFETVRQVLLSDMLNQPDEEQVYNTWIRCLFSQHAALFTQLKNAKNLEHLSKLGWTIDAARKYEDLLLHDPKFAEHLKQSTEAVGQAHLALTKLSEELENRRLKNIT
jgi:hypothetical protein